MNYIHIHMHRERSIYTVKVVIPTTFGMKGLLDNVIFGVFELHP
jgi:hypothetical protein